MTSIYIYMIYLQEEKMDYRGNTTETNWFEEVLTLRNDKNKTIRQLSLTTHNKNNDDDPYDFLSEGKIRVELFRPLHFFQTRYDGPS